MTTKADEALSWNFNPFWVSSLPTSVRIFPRPRFWAHSQGNEDKLDLKGSLRAKFFFSPRDPWTCLKFNMQLKALAGIVATSTKRQFLYLQRELFPLPRFRLQTFRQKLSARNFIFLFSGVVCNPFLFFCFDPKRGLSTSWWKFNLARHIHTHARTIKPIRISKVLTNCVGRPTSKLNQPPDESQAHITSSNGFMSWSLSLYPLHRH